MKKTTAIMVILILLAGLILLNCPNTTTTPDTNSNNSTAVNGGTTYDLTTKEGKTASAIANIPSFEVKLPASMAAGGTSAPYRGARAIINLSNESGFKSSSYKEFINMIKDSSTGELVEIFTGDLKSYAASNGSIPFNTNLSVWPGEAIIVRETATNLYEVFWTIADAGGAWPEF